MAMRRLVAIIVRRRMAVRRFIRIVYVICGRGIIVRLHICLSSMMIIG